MGNKGVVGTLRPGQGVGQPGLKDGLHLIFTVPGIVRIVKIMVNNGRKLVKTDSGGEHYTVDSFLKASSTGDADHSFALGEDYTYRVVFVVPKAATVKKIVIGEAKSRKWSFGGAIIQ